MSMGTLLKEQLLVVVNADMAESAGLFDAAKVVDCCNGDRKALFAKFAGVLSPAFVIVAGINGASLMCPTGL